MSRGAVPMGFENAGRSLATNFCNQPIDVSSCIIVTPELLNVYGVVPQAACPSMLCALGPAEAVQAVNSTRGQAGLDLNAVLLDFGFRFVFRFGREVQENRQNKTKSKTKTKRKTPFRSSPGPSPSPRGGQTDP